MKRILLVGILLLTMYGNVSASDAIPLPVSTPQSTYIKEVDKWLQYFMSKVFDNTNDALKITSSDTLTVAPGDTFTVATTDTVLQNVFDSVTSSLKITPTDTVVVAPSGIFNVAAVRDSIWSTTVADNKTTIINSIGATADSLWCIKPSTWAVGVSSMTVGAWGDTAWVAYAKTGGARTTSFPLIPPASISLSDVVVDTVIVSFTPSTGYGAYETTRMFISIIMQGR